MAYFGGKEELFRIMELYHISPEFLAALMPEKTSPNTIYMLRRGEAVPVAKAQELLNTARRIARCAGSLGIPIKRLSLTHAATWKHLLARFEEEQPSSEPVCSLIRKADEGAYLKRVSTNMDGLRGKGEPVTATVE